MFSITRFFFCFFFQAYLLDLFVVFTSYFFTYSPADQDELEERFSALLEYRASDDEYMRMYRKTQYVIRNNLPGSPVRQQETTPTSQDCRTDPSSVVALSFAKEDVKAALALKELLIEGCPSLQISEPRINDTSRLKALDAAEVIIIMLSPAYLNSSELVEELNIALYRHRMGSRQVIYPIELAPLPSKPTYVRLLPCDFSAMDFAWQLRVSRDKMTSIPQVDHLAKGNDIDTSVASCLLDASIMILKRLKDPDNYPGHREVIVNSIEVQKTWNEIRQDLSKEKGFTYLKLAFDVEGTSGEDQDRHSVAATDVKSTSMPMESESSAGKKTKVPVEQDETEQEQHKGSASDASSHHFKETTSRSAATQESHGAHKGSYDLHDKHLQSNKSKTKSCVIV